MDNRKQCCMCGVRLPLDATSLTCGASCESDKREFDAAIEDAERDGLITINEATGIITLTEKGKMAARQ